MDSVYYDMLTFLFETLTYSAHVFAMCAAISWSQLSASSTVCNYSRHDDKFLRKLHKVEHCVYWYCSVIPNKQRFHSGSSGSERCASAH